MFGFHPDKHRAGQKRAFKNGGLIRGPGTGTSDDVEMKAPAGSYIMPADSTAAIGAPALAAAGFNAQAGQRIRVSNGEYALPPEQVHAVGVQALNAARDATHTPAGRPPAEDRKMFFADGGMVAEETDAMRRAKEFGRQQAEAVQREGERLATNPPAPPPTAPAEPFAPSAAARAAQGEAALGGADASVSPAPAIAATPRTEPASNGQTPGAFDDVSRPAPQPPPVTTAAAPAAGAPVPYQPSPALPPVAPTVNSGGNITKTLDENGRPTYSGTNIGAGATINGATGGGRYATIAAGFDPTAKRDPAAAPAQQPGPGFTSEGIAAYAAASQQSASAGGAPAQQPGLGFKPGSLTALQDAAMSASGGDAAAAARKLAESGNADGGGQPYFQAPFVANSTNDYESRIRLQNAATAASSIANNQMWGRRGKAYAGAQSPAMLAYENELKNDATAQQANAKATMDTINANAGLLRERIGQAGSTQRKGMQEAGDTIRTGMTEAGHFQRAGLQEAGQTQRQAMRGRDAPAGYQWAAGGALAPIAGGPADPAAKSAQDKPLTEGQSKALTFGSRMLASGEILDRLATAGVTQPGKIKQLADAVGMGAAANWTQSPQQQQVEQAQRDFVNGVLRKESGAAINNAEFANARQQYFPQVGDRSEVIEQKRQNRELATRGMLAEVPGQQARVEQVRGSAPAPAQTPPSVARTGTINGRRVQQMSNGSIRYAD